MLARVTFWLAVGIGWYTYLGYPLVLTAWRMLRPRPARRWDIEPSVSLIIPVHNEASVIAAKIDNALAAGYPADRLEIVVLSDGSTDATVAVARQTVRARQAEGRVRIVEHAVNRGKIAVINDAVPTLTGEIVVFTDATAMFAPDAIRMLVRSYADPEVGGVGGIYRVSRPESARIGAQEDFYWRYESFVKRQEALVGSTLGAHGQIYSIRRSLYPFPAANTINDDYVVPVRIIQQGWRMVYDPDAIAYEDAREMTGFGRRVRIVAGNVQQLGEIGRLLRPFRAQILFCFVSHKLLRLVVPFTMAVAFVANLLLLDAALYRLLFWAQVVFYSLAVAGAIRPVRPKVLRLPYYFCMINAATFAAAYQVLWARRTVSWS